MKLEKLSATAELVSSVAIVVTLAYLAIQTQQNTSAIQATVRQAMLVDDLEILRLQIEYPVAFTGRSGDPDLTDEQLIQLNSYMIATVRVQENRWLQYQNGVIDEQTWVTYLSAFRGVFSTEFTRSWFRNRSDLDQFDEGFVDLANELLADSPILPDLSLRQRLGFDPQ